MRHLWEVYHIRNEIAMFSILGKCCYQREDTVQNSGSSWHRNIKPSDPKSSEGRTSPGRSCLFVPFFDSKLLSFLDLRPRCLQRHPCRFPYLCIPWVLYDLAPWRSCHVLSMLFSCSHLEADTGSCILSKHLSLHVFFLCYSNLGLLASD